MGGGKYPVFRINGMSWGKASRKRAFPVEQVVGRLHGVKTPRRGGDKVTWTVGQDEGGIGQWAIYGGQKEKEVT